MAITVASLVVSVAASTGQAQSGLLGLARMMGPGSVFAVGALAAAAVVTGIGVASVKMAADFQSGVTSLVTGAGESQANLGLVSKGILQMAVDTGTSTSQLVAGMYMIESGGFHGAAGLAILQAAAEGAKVGNADLGVVADTTDTILKNFGQTGLTASGAVNTLIATVANGKTHMADLSTALAQVLPTGAAAGIGLNDVMAAMATMTSVGVPAANAATYLRQTIIALSAPSAGAQKAMESFGLSASQVATEMHTSLPGALKEITDAIGKKFPEGSAGYIAAIKTISGGSKQMQGMLDLTGTHMKTFQGDVGKISGAAKDGGKSINGWSLVQGTFNQKMDRAKEVVETLMIKLGTGLLPVVGKLVDAFASHLPGAIDGVTKGIAFISQHSTEFIPVLGLLGGMILSVVVPAMIAMATATWAAVVPMMIAAAPFIAVGLAIGLLVMGVVLLVQHWKQIEGVARNVGIWFINLGKTIGGFLSGVWHDITSTVASWGTAFHNGVTFIQNLVKAGFALVYNIIMTPIRDIDALFSWLFQHNTYFHDLVLGIQKDMAFGKLVIALALADIKAIFTTIGNDIQRTAQAGWALVQTHIITPIRAVVAQVEERITYAKMMLNAAWVFISSQASAAWNRFTGFIGSAVATVKTDVTNIISAITTPITNLGQTLFNSGKNLIQMLINGITSMAGAVGNAAGNIMHNITSVLGFHSPTEKGEGATADRWMPALGAMLISGLNAQAAPAGAAANKIAAAISTGIKSATAPSALGVSGSGSISGLPSGMQQMNGLATATQNGQPIQITIVMDGKKVAQVVAKQLPSVLRNATGTRSF